MKKEKRFFYAVTLFLATLLILSGFCLGMGAVGGDSGYIATGVIFIVIALVAGVPFTSIVFTTMETEWHVRNMLRREDETGTVDD